MSKAGVPDAPPTAPMPGPAAVPPAYPSLPIEPPPPYTAYANAPPYGPQFSQPVPGQMPQFGAAPAPTYPPQATINVHVIHSRMGPFSQQVTCGKCGAQVMTATTARPGLLTWICSGALIVLGCVWGCCLIPCCVPECQDIEHHCPACRAHLGTFKRL